LNAIVCLRHLALQRLLVDADAAFREHDTDEEWSVARAVEIARDIDTRLADTSSDQAAWQQRQDQIPRRERWQPLRSADSGPSCQAPLSATQCEPWPEALR